MPELLVHRFEFKVKAAFTLQKNVLLLPKRNMKVYECRDLIVLRPLA